MIFIRSDKDVDFRGTIVQNGSAYADLNLAVDAHEFRGDGAVVSIRVLSIQNLAWTVGVYSRRRVYQADYDLDTLIDFHAFQTSDAMLSATTYMYSVTGIRIPYQDEDVRGELHVGLHNRSVTSKNPGDSGMVQLTMGMTGAG